MKKKGLAVFFERRERTMLQFPAYIRSTRFRRGLGGMAGSCQGMARMCDLQSEAREVSCN
jgi:hypothetical protein